MGRGGEGPLAKHWQKIVSNGILVKLGNHFSCFFSQPLITHTSQARPGVLGIRYPEPF